MKKLIINYLIKKLIRADFSDMNDTHRIRTYIRLKDPDVVQLFRTRYTNNLLAHFMANENEREQMKGRILEDLDILNSIEHSEEMMVDIDKSLEYGKQKRSILEGLKNKLVRKVEN
uniref:Uncharacterized protein n=1 Tax=viral metagenome TaxID=1070528 RepID=A0A6H1ZKW8_9ZZZZ